MVHPIRSFELHDLLPKLLDLAEKVRMQVFDVDLVGKALLIAIPRALGATLRPAWEMILEDSASDLDETPTSEQVDALIQKFIAAHSSPHDQEALLRQLRNLRKPRKMLTQAFWYRIRELNNYLGWLPGNLQRLTDTDIKDAIYNGMPEKWQLHQS